MASTFTTGFGIEKIGSGEQSGAWGTTTNHNLDILDRIASYKAVALSGSTHTLTVREASPGSGTENLQDGMYRVIKFTGALGANNTVTIAPNTAPAYFIFENATTDSGSSGPYSVILTQGSGANITIQNGKNAIVYCDGAGSGAAVVNALSDLQIATLEVTGAAAIDGALTATTVTTSGIVSVDDTTDSTSGTTGSIHTDGGLGVMKDIVTDNDMKVLDGGGLLVGHNARLTVQTVATETQIMGTALADSSFTIGRFSASAPGPTIQFLKSRDTNFAGVATVVDNDILGTINFIGDDGTDFATIGAQISARVNGTPGGNDMPTELVFGTTADSGSSPTERLLIGADGVATFSGKVVATTFEPTGDTAADDNAAIGYTSVEGLILTGQGSTSDITLKNDADATVFTVPTGTVNILFPDSAKAVFGTGADAEIYHDGSNMYLKNDTGNTLAYSDTFQFFSHTGSELFAQLNHNSAVKLYFDSALKFETTAAGANVSNSANDAILKITTTGTNKAANLELNNTVAGYNFISNNTNGTVDWRIGGGAAAGTLVFQTGSSNAERMRITAAGAVTIPGAVTNGTDAGDTRFIMNSANQYTLQFKNAGDVAGHIGGGGADVLRFSNVAGATTMQATSGNWTKPLQPAFLVHPNARINDVTGDGTAYTAVWNTEIFDQGGDFASNTFTAPVTGKYQFNVNISLLGIVSGHTTCIITLVTSNRSIRTHFKANVFAQTGSGDQNSFNGSVLTDMDASDTAHVTIAVAGGSKVVDFDGDSNYTSAFSGSLIA